MSNTPNDYIERLNEISSKKYTLLESMLDITKDQTAFIKEVDIEVLQKFIDQKQEKIDFIKEEDIKGLQKSIDQKQEKIDEINKLDENFNVYFQRLKQQLKINRLDELEASHGIEGVSGLKDNITAIMSIMKDIKAIEDQNSVEAQKRLNSIGIKLRKSNEEKRINSAYANNSILESEPYFINKRK